MASPTLTRQPHGLLRASLRLPIWLYRLHLGWLLGSRFVLLTHIGRKTGKPRQTVIEVVRYDKASGVVVVASGWGLQSDWFRNIQHHPRATITLGRHTWPAIAVVLPKDEAARSLLDYARHHPIAFRELSALMTGQPVAGTEEKCRELAETIPLVAFQPD